MINMLHCWFLTAIPCLRRCRDTYRILSAIAAILGVPKNNSTNNRWQLSCFSNSVCVWIWAYHMNYMNRWCLCGRDVGILYGDPFWPSANNLNSIDSPSALVAGVVSKPAGETPKTILALTGCAALPNDWACVTCSVSDQVHSGGCTTCIHERDALRVKCQGDGSLSYFLKSQQFKNTSLLLSFNQLVLSKK